MKRAAPNNVHPIFDGKKGFGGGGLVELKEKGPLKNDLPTSDHSAIERYGSLGADRNRDRSVIGGDKNQRARSRR